LAIKEAASWWQRLSVILAYTSVDVIKQFENQSERNNQTMNIQQLKGACFQNL
jgi:hypothetical protein